MLILVTINLYAVCRTIRDLINKHQTLNGTQTYIDVLGKLFNNYNKMYHLGIKGIPNKPDNERIKNIIDKKLHLRVGRFGSAQRPSAVRPMQRPSVARPMQ